MSDSLTCPFCQNANHCSVSAEQPCWCFQTGVPAALISLLPEQRDKTCICFSCIQAYQADAQSFIQTFQKSSS